MLEVAPLFAMGREPEEEPGFGAADAEGCDVDPEARVALLLARGGGGKVVAEVAVKYLR